VAIKKQAELQAAIDTLMVANTNGSVMVDLMRTLLKDQMESVDGRREESQRTVNTGSPTAILEADGMILFDSAAATIAIDLPAASVGKIKIPFKDIGANSSVNNITINRVGADTIVDSATGQTSTLIASNGFSGYFLSNGVDTWYLM